jgi:hypothetical protein
LINKSFLEVLPRVLEKITCKRKIIWYMNSRLSAIPSVLL